MKEEMFQLITIKNEVNMWN